MLFSVVIQGRDFWFESQAHACKMHYIALQRYLDDNPYKLNQNCGNEPFYPEICKCLWTSIFCWEYKWSICAWTSKSTHENDFICKWDHTEQQSQDCSQHSLNQWKFAGMQMLKIRTKQALPATPYGALCFQRQFRGQRGCWSQQKTVLAWSLNRRIMLLLGWGVKG